MTQRTSGRPLVVGIGGTTRDGSSTEGAVRTVLHHAEQRGARVLLFGARELAALPMYDPRLPKLNDAAGRLTEAVLSADGLVVASPGYHGSISGLVKNALDYIEELRAADRPYLSDRPVGCIATGHGWQATVTTMQALRSVVHALRGWPTPYGASINTAEVKLALSGRFEDEATERSLRLVADQVLDFCLRGRSAA